MVNGAQDKRTHSQLHSKHQNASDNNNNKKASNDSDAVAKLNAILKAADTVSKTVTDNKRRNIWLRNIRSGLLPYNGEWKTLDEIEKIQTVNKRRNWLGLFEITVILVLFLAFDALLFLIIYNL